MDTPIRTFHPLHLISVAAAMTLFLGALLADIAYGQTYEVQWTNFASWLLVGGQVFATLSVVLALVDFLRGRRAHGRWGGIYLLVLAIAWVCGMLNNLVHAMDAWQKMPQALVLSLVTMIAVLIAVWVAFSGSARPVRRQAA